MKMTRVKKYSLIGLVLVLIGVPVMETFRKEIEVPLRNGGSLHVKPASFWRSLKGSMCQIDYRPKDKTAGTVFLFQDFLHKPIIVVPVADNCAILCLYECDADLRLLRIDPDKDFQPFPTDSWSCLNAVVCSSPWKIEEAEIGDWKRALLYLKGLPPGDFIGQTVPVLDFGVTRVTLKRKVVEQRLEGQIRLMIESGATRWPVITNLLYPITNGIQLNDSIGPIKATLSHGNQ